MHFRSTATHRSTSLGRCDLAPSMTLRGERSAVDRFVGAALLGGSLLVAGVGIVSGVDVARADVSISPRCELRG